MEILQGIKAVCGRNFPVGVSNIKTPAVAERLLESGVCDFVGVGRAHIADPAWCRKAAMDRNDLIHHCIGCLYCFESLMSVGYVRCSVNPKAGRDAVFHSEPEKNGNGKKVAEAAPAAVFLASGGKPIVPELPGIRSDKVVLAADVIADRKKVCGNVLIAGAGLTGLETAEKLFRTDSADKITVIDMLPQIGANMYPSIFIDVTHQMEGKPLTLLAGRKLKEVTASGIIAENIADQTSEEIAADYVILAMGTRADSETIAAYESAFDRVITPGQIEPRAI